MSVYKVLQYIENMQEVNAYKVFNSRRNALICVILEASPYGRLLHRVPTRVASRTDTCCIAMQQKMFLEIVLFFLLSQ